MCKLILQNFSLFEIREFSNITDLTCVKFHNLYMPKTLYTFKLIFKLLFFTSFLNKNSLKILGT